MSCPFKQGDKLRLLKKFKDFPAGSVAYVRCLLIDPETYDDVLLLEFYRNNIPKTYRVHATIRECVKTDRIDKLFEIVEKDYRVVSNE